MTDQKMEVWDVWYPKAGATGLSFARGRIAAGAQVMLIHAAPPVLTVVVRLDNGQVVATGEDLESTDDTPITRMTRRNEQIERTDIWPIQSDIGHLVLLAGGEVGVLKQWWHAADQSEWRWQLELYNHR